MSKVQMLRALVQQRLTAAAQEIFGLFERTIAEYEEELCRSKEENERQRKLLEAVFNPQLRLHRADIHLRAEEKVPPEQQSESQGLNQEDNKVQFQPPHIKEEQEEVWTNQETELTFTPVPVKTEDEEKPQSSQLHQTEADGEDCGGAEPDWNSDPDPEDRTEEHEICLNFQKNNGVKSLEKPFRCFECGKRFSKNSKLKMHVRTHTGEKPFGCSVCGKSFSQKAGLNYHLKTHTGEKPFSCPICGKCFGQKAYLQKHLKCHSGEKPYVCLLCQRCFSRCEHLQSHMRTHTGEKPFCCSVCGRRFTWRCQLKNHNCGRGTSQIHEELWTNQGREQLQVLEEADITKFTSTAVAVKPKGEEKPQSSQLHQMKADGEDCGEPDRNQNQDLLGSQGRTCSSLSGQFW